MNPYDARALEAALRLRERGNPVVSEIVAVTMGPEPAGQTLQRAAALGADRTIQLSDPRLAGSDVNATAYALAAVLEREQPDLVLSGQQSDDGQSYVLPAAVAAHLGMACVSQVTSIDAGDGTPRPATLRLERQGDQGSDTVLVTLPAVVAVTEAINEPRYPSLPGIVAAKAKPRAVLSASDLGLDGSRIGHDHARALCFSFGEPSARPPARVLTGIDPEQAVQEILAWMRDRGVDA